MVRQVPLLGHPSQLSAVTALMAEGLGKRQIMDRTGLAGDRVSSLMAHARRVAARKAAAPDWTTDRVARAMRIYRAGLEVMAGAFGVSVEAFLGVVNHRMGPDSTPATESDDGNDDARRPDGGDGAGPDDDAVRHDDAGGAADAVRPEAGEARATPPEAEPVALGLREDGGAPPQAEPAGAAEPQGEPAAAAVATVDTNSPDRASEEAGGFSVAAAPPDSGATEGEEGDQTSQPVNVGGTPDATAGETAPLAPEPDAAIEAERELLAAGFPAAQRFTLRAPDGQVLHSHKRGLTRLPSFFWVGTAEQVAKLKRQQPEWAQLQPKAFK